MRNILFVASFVLLSSVTVAREQRYVSVDAGGMFGLIAAHLIAELEEQTGRSAYELFDGMTGVSIGAVITAALSSPRPNSQYPYTARELVSFFENHAKPIFDAARRSATSSLLGSGKGVTQAATVLHESLRSVFGNSRIQDSLKPIYVLVRDEKSRKNTLLSNAIQGHDIFLADVVIASSSISSIFGTHMGYLDPAEGGDADPTPYLCTELRARGIEAGDQITIYSIGTGFMKAQSAWVTTCRGIKIVRIEPDVSSITGEYPDIMMLNLYASDASPEAIQKLKLVADQVKITREFQSMVADFLHREGL